MVDGPGTISLHPFGAEMKWRAAGGSFFGSRCKAEGGGKKLSPNVAELRSRRRLRRRSSVRPNQSRSRWAWSGRRKEITSWLLSVSAFFCADNGFAGSLAGKPLNLKSVKFPLGRQGAKPKTGRTSAHAVCWSHRVRSGMEGACLSSAGQFLPLGEAGRFLVLLFSRLHADMAETDSDELTLIWLCCCVID